MFFFTVGGIAAGNVNMILAGIDRTRELTGSKQLGIQEYINAEK